MAYVGDITLGATLDTAFTTVQSTGAPTTLSGSPTILAKVGSLTVAVTAGVTVVADFMGKTGLNQLHVVASGANGFASGTDVQLFINSGTVNSVSAVGYVVAEFSIENRGLLRPGGTLAAVTAAIAAGGTVGVVNSLLAVAPNIIVGQTIAAVAGAVGSVTGNVGGGTIGVVNSVVAGTINVVNSILAFAPAIIKTASFTAGAIDAASIASDAGDEIANAVLAAATAAPIASNIKKINSVTVNGDGAGTPWGP